MAYIYDCETECSFVYFN